MSNIKRLETLYDRHMDGLLTSDEEMELAALLGNPVLQKKWRELSCLEGKLQEELLTENRMFIEQDSESRLRAVGQRGRTYTPRRSFFKPAAVWISLTACLVIVAGVFLWNKIQERSIPGMLKAQLLETEGGIQVERDGTKIHAGSDFTLQPGDVIISDSAGRASLRYMYEDSIVRISEDTYLKIDRENGAKRMFLKRGAVECSIAPQPPGKDMQVRTPVMTAAVKGTHFVMQTAKRASRIDVKQGIVEVDILARGCERVSSGEFLKVKPGLVIGPVCSRLPEDIVLDYTRPVHCQGKGNWHITQSQKGLSITQSDPESKEALIMFTEPRLEKGRISCELKVTSSRKRKTAGAGELPSPCLAFFWAYFKGEAFKEKPVSETNIKYSDVSKGLKKGKWYRLSQTFEVRRSEEKGTYFHVEWSKFSSLDGKDSIKSTIDGKQVLDVYKEFGPCIIGVGTYGFAVELRNVRVEEYE